MKYKLIHSFYKTKPLAKTNLAQVQRKWAKAKLIGDEIQGYAILMYETDDYTEAHRVMSQIFRAGLWCGFEI